MSTFFRLEKLLVACGPLWRASPLSLNHGLAKDVHSYKTQQRMPSCHPRSVVAHRIWLERCSGLIPRIFAHQIEWRLIDCLVLDRDAVPIHVGSDLSSDCYWKAARSKMNWTDTTDNIHLLLWPLTRTTTQVTSYLLGLLTCTILLMIYWSLCVITFK